VARFTPETMHRVSRAFLLPKSLNGIDLRHFRGRRPEIDLKCYT
jgi:hypothetical protein